MKPVRGGSVTAAAATVVAIVAGGCGDPSGGDHGVSAPAAVAAPLVVLSSAAIIIVSSAPHCCGVFFFWWWFHQLRRRGNRADVLGRVLYDVRNAYGAEPSSAANVFRELDVGRYGLHASYSPSRCRRADCSISSYYCCCCAVVPASYISVVISLCAVFLVLCPLGGVLVSSVVVVCLRRFVLPPIAARALQILPSDAFLFTEEAFVRNVTIRRRHRVLGGTRELRPIAGPAVQFARVRITESV